MKKPSLLVRRTALLSLGALNPGCAPDVPEETVEAIEEIEQAISQGDPASEHYNYAVRVDWDGGSCTGVLISPRWVLTANHCISGASGGNNSTGAGIGATLTVRIPDADDDPYDALPGDRIFTHTQALSGDILIRHVGTINGISDVDTSRDVALFKLDQRVPSTIAVPPPLPFLDGPQCPQSGKFEGTIIGFGGNKLVSESDDPLRRMKTGHGWDRNYVALSVGAYYSRHWTIPGLYTDDFYSGALRGDSGGPLVEGEGPDAVLCGVGSRYYPKNVLDCGPVWFPPFWMCGLVPAMASDYAAVDSPETIAFVEAAVVQTWSDGEQYLDGYCPAATAAKKDFDPDNDETVEACDNCPGVKNQDQADCDGDGVGDACDPCPCSTADSDEDGWQDCEDPCPQDAGDDVNDKYGDHDDDGVCNKADNCPYTANSKQLNTNALSEAMTGADKRGDACEPVPQPVATALKTTEHLGSVQSSFFNSEFSNTSANVLRVDPRGSVAGSIWNAGVATTHMRFCQPGQNGLPPFCDDATAVDDAQLHLGLASAEDEQPWMPYHRVTMDFDPSQRGATIDLEYFHNNKVDVTWDYQADADHWADEGLVTLGAESVEGEPASALEGMFWIHADTLVASDAAHDIGTGVHGPGLANNHFGIKPRYHTAWTSSKPLAEVGLHLIWRILPYPSPDRWMNPLFAEDRLLVAMPEGRFGFLGSNGRAQLADNLADEVTALLGGDVLIANAVESDGAASDAPLAMVLRAGGDGLLAGIMEKEGKLVTGAIGEDAAPPPPPAEGALPVYSRSLRAVFVVGAGDGRIWRASAGESAQWRALNTGVVLGQPLAATVSAQEEALYVIDLIEEREGATARLLRHDLARNETHVLGSWARGGQWDQHWLVLDRNGDVLLVASSRALGQHAVLRLNREGGAAGVRFGALPLAWPLLVAEGGYALFGHEARRDQVRPTQLAELGDEPLRNPEEAARVLSQIFE